MERLDQGRAKAREDLVESWKSYPDFMDLWSYAMNMQCYDDDVVAKCPYTNGYDEVMTAFDHGGCAQFIQHMELYPNVDSNAVLKSILDGTFEDLSKDQRLEAMGL